MKLSPAADYAIRGASVLAKHYGEGPVALEHICAGRDVHKTYLSKIFAALVRAGLVLAVRGKHGGYMLGREPNKITLLEVIEAVEGPIRLNFCTHTPSRCHEENCPFSIVWHGLQRCVREKLQSVTLDRARGSRSPCAESSPVNSEALCTPPPMEPAGAPH